MNFLRETKKLANANCAAKSLDKANDPFFSTICVCVCLMRGSFVQSSNSAEVKQCSTVDREEEEGIADDDGRFVFCCF